MKFCKKCKIDTERYARGDCKPCAKASHAAYRAINQDKVRERRKKYCAANVDKKRAANAKYIADNPEKKKERNAKYKAENPEKCRIHNQNRRARKLKNGGKLSQGLAERLFKLQKGKCPCCQMPLGDDYQLDHIMPIALGGSNTDDNMQLLRKQCNNQKHAKHPIDFMQSRGFLL